MQPLKRVRPHYANDIQLSAQVYIPIKIFHQTLNFFVFLMYVLQNKFQKSTCKEYSFVILVLSIPAETAIKSSYIPIFLFVFLKQTQHER